MTKLLIHHGGWKPSPPDHRDRLYIPHAAPVLPDKVDLRTRSWNGAVLNQGQIGTCVPNSNADTFHSVLGIEGHTQVMPSRLYIYAAGRTMEGTALSEDSGMYVRDALRVLAAGVPPETDWPYSDLNPGLFQRQPSAQATRDATAKAISYMSLRVGLANAPLRSCLAAGYPFTFGFSVPDFMESQDLASAKVRLLTLPTAHTKIIGGHGVKCMGYDFSCQTLPVPAFLIKNSWGPGWCEDGYFWMDYRYFSGAQALATDIWTIRLTS